MNPLESKDVVGRRIVDVIISVPDKPVSMSDMSESKGYLRLDSGLVIQIDGNQLRATEPTMLNGLSRDRDSEREFIDAVGEKIVDVVRDELLLYVLLKDGMSLSTALGQFWIHPCLDRNPGSVIDAKSIW